MNKSKIVQQTKKHLKEMFESEGSGHDWWHIQRVLNNAIAIARKEKGADIFIVQLGALLHDIADHKFHDGDDTVGGKVTESWLREIGADEDTIKKAVHIVDNVSFKGLGVKNTMKGLEGKIVQDADRLDAIGAIGIARAFSYGGFRNRPLYDPNGYTRKHKNFEDYKKNSDSTIHHFHEKLLHMKKLMNTKTGKYLAQKRHKFIESYLKEFYAEWEGKK